MDADDVRPTLIDIIITELFTNLLIIIILY